MAETKYSKELAAAKIMLEDIGEELESEEKEDIKHGYERINEIIKKLESSKDHTTEQLLSEERTIEENQVTMSVKNLAPHHLYAN